MIDVVYKRNASATDRSVGRRMLSSGGNKLSTTKFNNACSPKLSYTPIRIPELDVRTQTFSGFLFRQSTEEARSCQEFWVCTPHGRNHLDTKDANMTRSDIIARRRRFSIRGYKTLTDVGLDGDYVAPI